MKSLQQSKSSPLVFESIKIILAFAGPSSLAKDQLRHPKSFLWKIGVATAVAIIQCYQYGRIILRSDIYK